MGLMLEGLMKQAEEENARRKAQEERERAEAHERGLRFQAFDFVHTAFQRGMTLQEALVYRTTWIEWAGPHKHKECPNGLVPYGNLYDMALEVYERVSLDLKARRATYGRAAHELLEAHVGPCPCSECPFRK
jgi:hypothetical protein